MLRIADLVSVAPYVNRRDPFQRNSEDVGSRASRAVFHMMNQSLPSSADTEVVRPYTPVDQRLAAGPDPPSQEPDLYLMIKVYPDGVFTQHLNSLQTGERPRHFCLQAVVSPSVFCCVVFDDDSFYDLQCHRTFFLVLVCFCFLL